jgi:hypothetical protein
VQGRQERQQSPDIPIGNAEQPCEFPAKDGMTPQERLGDRSDIEAVESGKVERADILSGLAPVTEIDGAPGGTGTGALPERHRLGWYTFAISPRGYHSVRD